MNARDVAGAGTTAALFDQLLWIDDPVPRDGALHMAIDEALLTGPTAAGEAARPILRVYRWSEPAGSFGYFEPLAAARRALPGRQLVRRWTGGGIVPHGDDLTYSLLVPRTLVPADWRADVAYNRIHEVLAAVLRAAGLSQAVLSREAGTPRKVAGSEAALRECFVQPVRHDVMLAGRKVAGAAQRKTRHGLLHQGSVQLPDGAAKNTRLGPGTELHAAICTALPTALARKVVTRRTTEEEIEKSRQLAAARYGTPEWMEKF